MQIIIHAAWQRVAFGAIFVIPLILIILLMIPVFLCLPFSERARQFILNVLDKGLVFVKHLALGEEGVEGSRKSMLKISPTKQSPNRTGRSSSMSMKDAAQ